MTDPSHTRSNHSPTLRLVSTALLVALTLTACLNFGRGRGERELDTDFDIPRTEAFPENLSAYGLYEGEMAALVPAEGVHLYEIPSKLFTDYAKKQRLVKLPEGQRAMALDSRVASYPDGTVVAKTFLYPHDFRDASAGQRVIETRVMVMTDGVWNVATYIWNEEQTDATLSLDDVITQVEWIDEDGKTHSTAYEIPGEVACVTCHQNSGEVALLGLTPRNLNRTVSRDGQEVDQLTYLQSQGVYGEVDPATIGTIIDSEDTSHNLERRARAYLDANCAHCHNPDAWEEAAEERLDFRYETPFADTNISRNQDEIARLLSDGEMPYVGTTVLHEEGLDLILAYLDSL